MNSLEKMLEKLKSKSKSASVYKVNEITDTHVIVKLVAVNISIIPREYVNGVISESTLQRRALTLEMLQHQLLNDSRYTPYIKLANEIKWVPEIMDNIPDVEGDFYIMTAYVSIPIKDFLIHKLAEDSKELA